MAQFFWTQLPLSCMAEGADPNFLFGDTHAADILNLMTHDSFTFRETLLVFTGAAIALLLVAAGTSFYKHDYRHGIWCFVVAVVLGFVIFRKRILVLVTTSLGSILALGSLGLPFHPSFAGFALLIGCALSLYLTVRWSYKKYPYLSYKHVHTVFDGEAAIAAENARIEAEARELVKKRPHGPWLFR